MICIIDYGVGNLASILNMLKKVGAEARITGDEREIMAADKIILPGVGSFDTCAGKLNDSGLLAPLSQRALMDRVPILGICVGMQLLFEKSAEGKMPGLGWIKGSVVKFDATKLSQDIKIPHIGWTDVALSKQSRVLSALEHDARYYFVHSYHALPSDPDVTLMTAQYGYSFPAAVEVDNIIGVQFHPEKSHRFGMNLLSSFATFRN
jgi:glutamine amidotransferase